MSITRENQEREDRIAEELVGSINAG